MAITSISINTAQQTTGKTEILINYDLNGSAGDFGYVYLFYRKPQSSATYNWIPVFQLSGNCGLQMVGNSKYLTWTNPKLEAPDINGALDIILVVVDDA